uniref:Uncharacterized protein n=1 Tax=viral metagenome TaxID=1070528 RepID=A0A6M3J699_9ZZZZ
MSNNDTKIHRCEGEVKGGRYHTYQCEANASVQRDGWWYCKRHDPERILERELEKHH